MTCSLSLILWMAAAQTADRPAPAPAAVPTPAAVTVPATVILQYVPSDTERTLRAQLDEARDQLAKLKAESGMADHAIAALLVSDRPGLASLRRCSSQSVRSGTRRAEIDVYGPTRKEETLVAVVVSLKNPRDQKTWEPTEAWVRVPFNGSHPYRSRCVLLPSRFSPASRLGSR